LYLELGDWEFAAIADLVSQIDELYYFLVVEDKHRYSNTYLHGQLQLACGLIAAAQKLSVLNTQDLYSLCGVLVVADQFKFVRVDIPHTYLQSLFDKTIPEQDLVFSWFPGTNKSKYMSVVAVNQYGLHYGIMEEREVLVKTLIMLREHFEHVYGV